MRAETVPLWPFAKGRIIECEEKRTTTGEPVARPGA